VATDGSQAIGRSDVEGISASGRFVVFRSNATNLAPGDVTDGDVFLRDQQARTTTRVSGCFTVARISADGGYVTCNDGGDDTLVIDRTTDTARTVNVALDGGPANAASGVGDISAHGRFIAFTSIASKLVASDTNERADVFVHDTRPQQH
jgi:hypothetical protein